jgi:hypothetical protein
MNNQRSVEMPLQGKFPAAERGLLCAALAELCSGGSSDAVSEAISAGHKLLAANFVYGASHTFDQIIYTGAHPPFCQKCGGAMASPHKLSSCSSK